jgi:hypothetical protein
MSINEYLLNMSPSPKEQCEKHKLELEEYKLEKE